MEWFSKCCVHGVQVGNCIRRDFKKGQNACWPVQIYSHDTSGVSTSNKVYKWFVMSKIVRIFKAPRLFIVTKTIVRRRIRGKLRHPVDTFICHCNICRKILNLPIMATCQTFFTQNLIFMKSFRMIRIWLVLWNSLCLSVLLG